MSPTKEWSQSDCNDEFIRLERIYYDVLFIRSPFGPIYSNGHPVQPLAPATDIVFGHDRERQKYLAELIQGIERLAFRHACEGGRLGYVLALDLVTPFLGRLPDKAVPTKQLERMITRLSGMLRDLNDGTAHPALRPASKKHRPHKHSRVQAEFKLSAVLAVEAIATMNQTKSDPIKQALEKVAKRATPAAVVLGLAKPQIGLTKTQLRRWRDDWKNRPNQKWPAPLLIIAAEEFESSRGDFRSYVEILFAVRLSPEFARLEVGEASPS